MEETGHKAGIDHMSRGVVCTVIEINRHPFVGNDTIKDFFSIRRVKVTQHIPT
jgi:hypothetical protein